MGNYRAFTVMPETVWCLRVRSILIRAWCNNSMPLSLSPKTGREEMLEGARRDQRTSVLRISLKISSLSLRTSNSIQHPTALQGDSLEIWFSSLFHTRDNSTIYIQIKKHALSHKGGALLSFPLAGIPGVIIKQSLQFIFLAVHTHFQQSCRRKQTERRKLKMTERQ